MDRGWNTVPASGGGTRKCNCRYCTAGCFHGSRGLASAHQRQPVPYMRAKKKGLVHMRRNGGYPPGRAPSTEPDWAQRQAGRIRAWRQAEKIRAWRQALNREQQAVSGEQASEAKPGEDTDEEEVQASEDTGVAPTGEQPAADLALNGDRGFTDLSSAGCQESDSAGDGRGDIDLASTSDPGGSEPGNPTGEQSELSTGSEQGDVELVPPRKKKAGKTRHKVLVPADKTWALEQAARIRAWREAKKQELTEVPGSTSADTATVEVENLPLNQSP